MLQVLTKNTNILQFKKINSPYSIDETLHEKEESFSKIKKNQQPIKNQNRYQNRHLLYMYKPVQII